MSENQTGFYKDAFRIDDGPSFLGYTNGKIWNGYNSPWFDQDVGQKIADSVLNESGEEMIYDARRDAFVLNPNTEDEDVFKGEDIPVAGVTRHLYPIGADDWCWKGSR